jgi:hypothetical protein
LQESDFPIWLRFYKDQKSLEFIHLTGNPDPQERCRIWFERVFNRYSKGLGGMNVLIDKITEEFIGQCGLMTYTIDSVEELEIGYSLMRNTEVRLCTGSCGKM